MAEADDLGILEIECHYPVSVKVCNLLHIHGLTLHSAAGPSFFSNSHLTNNKSGLSFFVLLRVVPCFSPVVPTTHLPFRLEPLEVFEENPRERGTCMSAAYRIVAKNQASKVEVRSNL